VLRVWRRGAADYDIYVKGKKSVVDMVPRPIGKDRRWCVPTFAVGQHPELAT
jgi:hypothetical protein